MARESKQKRDAKRFGKPERLADRIVATGLTYPKLFESYDGFLDLFASISGRAIATVGEATVVHVQNVAEYCDAHHGGQYVDYSNDIPNYIPPRSPLFVEFSRGKIQHGYLIQDFGGKEHLPASLRSFQSKIPEGVNHVIFAEHFLGLGDTTSPIGPFASYMMPIDSDGRLVGEVLGNVCYSSFMDDLHFKNCVNVGASAFFPVFFAVSLMHCKNVAIASVDPDPAVNRARLKAGHKPFLRYHTINIDPMKKVLRTEGDVETEGLKKALHICRGHFATYSEDKPLFGHFTGTVWKPAHVRGSAKQGVVVSDYNVKAPQ